jgi:predicted 3-demethylubiquinone-9 3-methyltransferase (glyoxalase superfamily)
MDSIHCDAIKVAYRQTKDGYNVSFQIHPSDMPVALANADIGSQWKLTLVELDENGNAPT